MLLTVANKNAATSLVENNPEAEDHLPDAARRRILNSTVKLVGKGAGKGSTFTGSGVIFYIDADKGVYILTAAHNVLVQAKAPMKRVSNMEALLTQFTSKVQISYGGTQSGGDMSFNTDAYARADITGGQVNLGSSLSHKTDNYLYDLVVLWSKDSALKTYTQKWVFGDGTTPVDISAIQSTMKTEAEYYQGSTNYLLDNGYYHHIQLGYGKNFDDRYSEQIKGGKIIQGEKQVKGCESGTGMTSNHLHYRLAQPTSTWFPSSYLQTAPAGKSPAYLEFVKSIVMEGKVQSTTAEGDSGGPLFAVEKEDLGIVCLIGVTTGADMHAAQKPYATPFGNCISASVLPFYDEFVPFN